MRGEKREDLSCFGFPSRSFSSGHFRRVWVEVVDHGFPNETTTRLCPTNDHKVRLRMISLSLERPNYEYDGHSSTFLLFPFTFACFLSENVSRSENACWLSSFTYIGIWSQNVWSD